MTLSENITEINRICDRSLSITCYAGIWEVSSYRSLSALCNMNRVQAETLEGAVDRALVKAHEWERRKAEQAEVMTA